MCLICLHRRNHLTATSRRVKFSSNEKDQDNCLTAFDYFKEMNIFFLNLNCTWMTVMGF